MKLLLLILIIIFIILTDVIYLKKKRKVTPLMLLCNILLFTSIFLYRRFLLGDPGYLFTTVDGFSQYLPLYRNLALQIKDFSLSTYSLSVGFGRGQNIDMLLYPLNLIPTLLGVLWGDPGIYSGFAWMQVLKILLAGFFMFLFLKKLALNDKTAVFISTAYALNGTIILRGNWIFLADECFLIVFLLWAVECYLKDKDYRFIPLVIYLLVSCLGIYYVYLYALLCIIYGITRCIYAQKNIKETAGFIICAGGLFALGILMRTAIIMGFSLPAMFETARFSDTTGYFNLKNIFEIVDLKILVSGFMSTLNPSILGTFDLYSGALNYLERPMFYTGIPILFLMVQAVILKSKKERRLWIFGAGLIAAYMVFPIVTDIFCAFIKNEEMGARSYRISSLWILVLMNVMAAYGIENFLKRKGRLKLHIFTAVIGIICTIASAWYCVQEGYTVNNSILVAVLALIVIWTVLGVIIKKTSEEKRKALYVVCYGLLLGEVVIAAHTTIGRMEVYADSYMEQTMQDPLGYYGNANDAIQYLKDTDDGLYRVGGLRLQAGVETCCSALYYNVFDSCYYTDIDQYTYDFISTVDPESFPVNDKGSKYSVGVGDDYSLAVLCGYKYYLCAHSDDNSLYGYTKIKTIGNVDIFENDNYLSFGIGYSSYVYSSDLEGLSAEKIKTVLLNAVIVDDDIDCGEMSELDLSDIDFKEDIEDIACRRKTDLLDITSWSETQMTGSIDADEDLILSFSVAFSDKWVVEVDGEPVDTFVTNIGFLGIRLDKGEHTITYRYVNRGLKLGIIVSVIGWGIYLVLFFLYGKNLKRKKQNPENKESDVNDAGKNE